MRFLKIVLLMLVFSSFNVIAQTTLIIKPGASEGKDAVLPWHNPDENHATNTSLHVTAWTYSGIPTKTRVLLDFDFSDIPQGAVIQSALLNLYYNFTSDFNNGQQSGNNEGAVYRVTESWNESTVTWNNQPSYTAVGSIAYPASVNYNDALSVNVTQMAQLFIDSPSISHGFMLKLNNEDNYRARLFASSDHLLKKLHPELVIEYIYTGIEQEEKAAFQTKVFPVPVNNTLHIIVTLQGNAEIQYQIINTLGAVMAEGNSNQSSFSVDVSALQNGIYFIRLQSGNAQTVKRFVRE
jgi:hypothetical protein